MRNVFVVVVVLVVVDVVVVDSDVASNKQIERVVMAQRILCRF